MLTVAPAELCGLTNKGTLAAGADADVTIIDPEVEWTIDVTAFRGKSRNCPFDGWRVRGRATHTIVGGEVKFVVEECGGWLRGHYDRGHASSPGRDRPPAACP